jgi:cellulose synthase/poly-beta-1,6-N-acetylglucosamine synthase-like glycosyltransferase
VSSATILGLVLVCGSLLTGLFAYVGYPLLLRLLPAGPPLGGGGPEDPGRWPSVTIVLPAHNEERSIAATIESLLALDYPSERRQILVVSDASSDRTHEIVQGYGERGVELHVLPTRRGKTAAENESRMFIRGEIVVNTDASVRVDRDALKRLVAAFRDPTVGVASGRDVSVGSGGDRGAGESGYVGYEMWVRDLETRTGGIVGASGCFFASRPDLHREIVPEALSRDFAAPLIAREHGYRSVSVPDAVCYVPRTTSLRREYRRKVRTMLRGLETLFYKRALLNPFRHGSFALKLWCHKLIRWLVPWAALLVLVGLVLLAVGLPQLRWPLLTLGAAIGGFMAVAWWWPPNTALPSVLAVPCYVLFGLLAGVHAWIKALSGDLNPVWEPTRRDAVG